MANTESNNPNDDKGEIVRRQLDPIFATFSPSSPQYMTFMKSSRRFALRIEKTLSHGPDISQTHDALQKILQALMKTNDFEALPTLPSIHRMVTHINMFTYLSSVELLATPYVDLTILLLTSKGIHLHIPPDRHHFYYRHALSLDDLDSPALPLSMKLEFLQENEITFFSKWIDRDLRNRIAHSDYEINDEGQLVLEANGKKNVIDIRQKLLDFFQYSNAVQSYVTQKFQSTLATQQK